MAGHHLGHFADESTRSFPHWLPIEAQSRPATTHVVSAAREPYWLVVGIHETGLGMGLFKPVRRIFRDHPHQQPNSKFVAIADHLFELFKVEMVRPRIVVNPGAVDA